MGAKNSMAFNKHALERMGKKGVANYSNLLSAPFAVTQALGISQKIRPAFNLVISNVAGPKETMYLKGSELLGLYAGTLLFEGQAVSILITSYADSLDFCVTVCKETVPDYEKLTDFLGEELCELEKLAEEKSS
jgi:diacylglycerol O-acyltransferase